MVRSDLPLEFRWDLRVRFDNGVGFWLNTALLSFGVPVFCVGK